MILSFNQPAFIPWGGFFCRLMTSDIMVLLDDTLFAQGFTFVNRNRIKGPLGEIWTTVPLINTHGQRQKIKDLKIHEKAYWVKKWLHTLYHAYSKSFDYKDIINDLKQICGYKGSDFLAMILAILELLKDRLNLSIPFKLQSDLGIVSGGIQLLLDIARELKAKEVVLPYFSQHTIAWKEFEKQGIKVQFLYYYSPVYPQFWGKYIRNLSVLDLLFCMGKESRRILENGFKIISYQ
jgi:hypothetical protein